MAAHAPVQLVDLEGGDRERAVPVVVDSFVGVYRWHAKRTLRQVTRVRAALVGGEVAAVAMLERLDPALGYVYYLAVRRSFRRRGIAGQLLDDALDEFRRSRVRVVWAAAEAENAGSIALFLSRGFRTVSKQEASVLDGGLGARGYRSKMWIVSGEVLLGLRLAPEPGLGPATGRT